MRAASGAGGSGVAAANQARRARMAPATEGERGTSRIRWARAEAGRWRWTTWVSFSSETPKRRVASGTGSAAANVSRVAPVWS